MSGQTMTIGELRAKLAEYPEDMLVYGGWEGVWGRLRPDGFVVEGGNLIIDVEDYV